MMRATNWKSPYVHLECGCGKEWGIEDLYYCYACAKILCPYCVIEEIDSFYCRNCMENMPTTEANAFKHRCSRCYQCPVCFITLQVNQYNYKGQKFYHFGCASCYWDSMNLELKGNSLNDLFVIDQERFRKDTSLQDRVKSLMEIYKEATRFKRKTTLRHPSVKETWTVEDLENSMKAKENLIAIHRSPVQSPSLNDLLSENLIYCEISSMPQRLMNLAIQSRELAKCPLSQMQLLTKRSKRCKNCKKYVAKPETNPSSTSFFKMENLLVNIFPRIMIRQIREEQILLILVNPNSSVSYVKIEGLHCPDTEIYLNSYDPVMDMVTSEGGVNDEYERDKNQVVIPVGKQGKEVFLQLFWRFMRGLENKNIVAKVHINLET